MYRSCGSLKSGSPYRRANAATPSTVSGVESAPAGAATASSGWAALGRATSGRAASGRAALASSAALTTSEVLVVDVGRLLHARFLLRGALVEVDRLLVPQQRAPFALLFLERRLLLLELVQELRDVGLVR